MIPAVYTLREAADALRMSVRTLRRRIADGDLSATKDLRGKLRVWTIAGAELVRYAQMTNQPLTAPTTRVGTPMARDGTPGEVGNGFAEGVQGQSPATASAGAGRLVQLEADLERATSATAAAQAEVSFLREIVRNLSQRALPAGRDQDAAARIETLEAEVADLRSQLSEQATPARRPWWRLWRRGPSLAGRREVP